MAKNRRQSVRSIPSPFVFMSLQIVQERMAEAQKTAKIRGHIIAWDNESSLWRERRHGHCVICGATVSVYSSPAPNGIDIAGSALAIDCVPIKPDFKAGTIK